ncbi:MAG: cob(I)yrinic acid a,c-diamide adenosyltransferase [Candidatus Methanomethylicia archaeon]
MSLLSNDKMGLIRVFTGSGKGKTTSAFGYALRLIGYGMKVCIIQFMKSGLYGEFIAAEKLRPFLTIIQFGEKRFVNKEDIDDNGIRKAKEALEYAAKTIKSGNYDLVILDEINVAIGWKLVDLEDVIKILREKPKHVEVILTGRYAPKELMDVADEVVEYVEVKHPSKIGIKARPGVEY